jgi:peptidyl-prolyl cis-trans isomerase C
MSFIKKNIKLLGIICATLLTTVAVWKFAVGQDKSKGDFVFDSQKPVVDYTKVVATVNGYKITEGEFQSRVEQLSPQAQARFKSQSARKELMDQLISEVLMESSAVSHGLEKDPKTAGELAVSRREVLIKDLSVKEIQKVAVTQEDIKKWYGDHLADLMQPESVHVKHILVKSEADAKKVLADLKKKGANFAKIASDVSLDPGSKQMGGDLGFVTRGQTVPEFEAAAFNTPVGKISDIIHTQFGYHILMVEDKKASGPIPMEQIQDQIKERLKYELYVKPLKEKANIEIVDAIPNSGPGAVAPSK